MRIEVTLTAKGYTSKLSPKLQLWQGDTVFIEFTLINTLISSIGGVESEECMPVAELQEVKLLLQNPNGVDTVSSTRINGNKVEFKLLPEHTATIGEYDFQLRCYDADGCKFCMPPNKYTIKEPIADVGEIE